MSPSTSCGEASVALLAETFGLSRQAVYAARVARQAASPAQGHPPTTPPEVPSQGRGVPAEALADAIASIVQHQPAWGIRRSGPCCAAKASASAVGAYTR
jgi:hypothetical protein